MTTSTAKRETTPPTEMFTTLSLESYIALVDRCARNRLNHPIANGSAVHARILIAKLFEVARNEVRIITGSLREVTDSGVGIYGNPQVITQAKNFLRKPDTRLEILIQSGKVHNGAANLLLSELSKDSERQGTIELKVPAPSTLGYEVPHFMVADGSAYRLETGEDARPANRSFTAVANFGDAPVANSLWAYFEELVTFLQSNKLLKNELSFGRSETITSI